MAMGELTAAEAREHPRRNVITRAADTTVEPLELDRTDLTDVRRGDVFLLCSDGVNEALNDAELTTVIGKAGRSLAETAEVIRENCARLSSDNYTFHLLRVGDRFPGDVQTNGRIPSDASAEMAPTEPKSASDAVEVGMSEAPESTAPARGTVRSTFLLYTLLGAAAVLALAMIYQLLNP